MAKGKETNTKEEPIETQLWKAADKLRKNIDAVEYKHIVLDLIFYDIYRMPLKVYITS